MKKVLTFKHRVAAAASLVLLACIAVPQVVSHAQQAKAKVTLESLAARVQYLEDEREIQNLLIAYERTLDTRDFKAYSELFTKDGEWSGGMGTAKGGPQAVYDLMTRGRGGNGRNAAAGGNAPAAGGATGGGRQATIGWGSTYHIMSNFKVDINGDTATASSRWTFITAARGPGINLAGRYEDVLEREDGRWKFKKRLALNEVSPPAAAPAAAAAPAGGR
jgi:hypothetical protein